MRIPDSLAPLFDHGILDEVVRPLMSGKEAQVYIVVSGGQQRVAKVYKEAQNRTFKQRAEYTEGRKVRNSRDQRAIHKRTKHGRAQDEAAWRSTEVDMISRLSAAGVRVPVPQHFIDGVLIMELVVDAEGNPAPRLADLEFDAESAEAMYGKLMREVVKMLCAGVVHGDLSDFNVLVGADGPVIIDFPQSVDAAHNTNARKILLRDVDNLHRFLARFVPNARRYPYAEEMWDLFQSNSLAPDTKLTGRYRASERRANTHAVLELIQDANYDERKRRDTLGLRGGPAADRAPNNSQPSRRGPQPNQQQPRNNQPRNAPQPNHQQPSAEARSAPQQNQQQRSSQPRNAPQQNQQQPRNNQPRNAPQPNQQQRRSGPSRGAPQQARPEPRTEGRRPEVIIARRNPTPR